MYNLRKETLVTTDMGKAWDFIRNPGNLNLITPPDMAFEIVSELPDEMFEGMLVEYRVRIPVVGTRPWLSELKHIVPGRSFVDEQKIGPYKLWYHYHALEQVGDKIKFIDQVTYEVPYCIFGKMAHALFIRKMLERIFAYREERFKEIFS